MSTRTYHSIGDVLTLLREEFPDITISKIRFLESQGLVSPQRSPSGYRKFYDEDIERLRYVLVQQREHFQPLKVIRDRLHGVVSDDDTGAGDPAPSAPGRQPAATVAAEPPASEAPREPTVADVVAALQEVPVTRPSAAVAPLAPATGAPTARRQQASTPPDPAQDALTIEELSVETGLSEAEIRSLVDYGILHEGSSGGLACFDALSVEVARRATAFFARGVEPRHLRLYRNAVEREMGLIEQVVTPLLRQRNPDSRVRAEETAEGLAAEGEALRAAMLAVELRALLER